MALLRFDQTKSTRGKILLTNGGYEYVFEAISKLDDASEYWRCPRKPPYCPGRACVRTGWQVDAFGNQFKEGRVTGEHNHAPLFGAKMVRETAERLREEARSDFPTSSRNIIREVRADLPIEVRAASAPSPSNMRWNYNYAKRKHQEELGDDGLDFQPAAEIIIPPRTQHLVLSDQLNNGERMIIFCSPAAIEALRTYNAEVAIDGTFETSPRGFSQLYTLSAIIEHCSIPCVYALLPNKTLLTYTRFFRAIRDAMPAGWQPIRIMSDFERAAISAANEIFPNSTSTGCLFHFGNALFRRIQHLPNLFTRFREDENTRMALRSVQALAFVPLEFVYNYFCLVMSPLEPIADLQDFIMYFINTWIGARQIIENEPILEANQGGAADAWIRGRIIALNLANSNAMFPRELWNVVDRVAAGIGRTNNSVEAWHSIWNVHLKGNQRLSSFIRKMIEEDNMWANRIADFQAAPADGIRGPHDRRKAKYIRQDNNLQALVADFNQRDPLEYLRACAYHLHF